MKGKHAKSKQDSGKKMKTKKQLQIKKSNSSLKNVQSNTNKKIKVSSDWKKREAASISDIRNYAMNKTKQRKRKRRVEQILFGILRSNLFCHHRSLALVILIANMRG